MGGEDDLLHRGTPYDPEMRPKAAWCALRDALAGQEQGSRFQTQDCQNKEEQDWQNKEE